MLGRAHATPVTPMTQCRSDLTLCIARNLQQCHRVVHLGSIGPTPRPSRTKKGNRAGRHRQRTSLNKGGGLVHLSPRFEVLATADVTGQSKSESCKSRGVCSLAPDPERSVFG